MKLLIYLSLLINIVNSRVVQNTGKEQNNESIEYLIPSSTFEEPTKTRLQKRAKTTEYIFKKNITIFEEGMKSWDSDWVDLSWTVSDENKIVNGVIQVNLVDNAAFSLQSKTLESKYGIITFDYKLSTDKANLNFISFDENDYVVQGNYPYDGSGNYITMEQPIKNHGKNEFIDCIKRFAWQNYGNEMEFTLYLRRIIYTDIDYSIKKYDRAVSVIDDENCQLSKYWIDISETDDRTSFEIVDGKCVMKIKSSIKNPAIYELKNRKFYGGKFEIKVKSDDKNALLTWYSLNSNDSDVDEQENDTYPVSSDYLLFINEEFETDDIYNALKIEPIMSSEITYDVITFNFYPISVDENIQLYETTYIEEPDVILDSNGLNLKGWMDNSWGTTCQFQVINSCMECTFVGKEGAYPAFSFRTENSYNSGTLVIVMKVLNPDQNINIQIYDTTGVFYNVYTFRATTEYAEYRIPIPSYENYATNRYAIQEASQLDNTFYIKSIIYYPPYINIPDENETKTTTKKTKTTQTTQLSIPTSEEEIYIHKGYKSCSKNTKIVFSDGESNWGIEENEWCAILSENIECWSNLQGYKCCSENAYIEDNSVWGIEQDGSKCGVNKSNVCWAKEMGYECCSINNTKIIHVDENGPWGATKDDKWCGII